MEEEEEKKKKKKKKKKKDHCHLSSVAYLIDGADSTQYLSGLTDQHWLLLHCRCDGIPVSHQGGRGGQSQVNEGGQDGGSQHWAGEVGAECPDILLQQLDR